MHGSLRLILRMSGIGSRWRGLSSSKPTSPSPCSSDALFPRLPSLECVWLASCAGAEHGLLPRRDSPLSSISISLSSTTLATQQRCQRFRMYSLLGRCKECTDREDQIEGAEQQPLEPSGFPIQTDERIEPSY